MNTNAIESKISLLEHLLAEYYNLWYKETLNQFLYNDLQNDMEVSFEELYFYDNYGFLPNTHPLHKLTIDLKEASTLPMLDLQNNSVIDMPLKSITPKKNHEILSIARYIQNNINSHGTFELYDLAGGKGILSSFLLNYFPNAYTKSFILDKNVEFINQHNLVHNLNFIPINLLTDEFPYAVTSTDHLFMLHGCGDLTDKSLEFFLNSKSGLLLTVGCCYHLCTHDHKFESNNLFKLTKDALYLATRTNKVINKEAWNKRLSQKHYRYCFEMWYFKTFNKIMPALRSSPPTLYTHSFEFYSREQIRRLKINDSPHLYKSLLKEYLEGEKLREKLIGIGALRLIFARPIEVYLALRRVKSMFGHGFEITIGELFNRKISPRNIAIALKR